MRTRLTMLALPATAFTLAAVMIGGALTARARADRRPAWIVGAATVERVSALDRELAHHFFDNARTFEITTRSGGAAPGALAALSFADERALQDTIVSGALPPGTKAVVYDDEDWPLTPVDQQLHPARYYRLAAAVAHRHGLLLIATPATDLVNAIAPGTGKRKYDEFLRLGIPAAAARYADAYEIQAQGSEADTSVYASFVRRAAAQAARANPGVELLAGVSTNPSGHVQPASVLFHAAEATRSIVSGWWLNDPAGGKACPKCTGPYPQIAVAFLRLLRRA